MILLLILLLLLLVLVIDTYVLIQVPRKTILKQAWSLLHIINNTDTWSMLNGVCTLEVHHVVVSANAVSGGLIH
jgi:hypothetical protein